MKHPWLFFCGLCLAGCMANNSLQYEAVSENNIYHIAKIRKGMSESQVLQIMHKPFSYETFEIGEDIYDVWFYVTRTTGLDQTRMVPQNLTPLTFKNGVLVGTGYYWYYYAMKEQAEAVAAQNPQPPKKTQEEEDLEFERALKTYPEQKAPVPAPKPHLPAQTTQSQCNACPENRPVSSLTRGMTETQVFDVMGEPVKYETFEWNGHAYDVWFYETVPSFTGQESAVPQITPLTFKDAFLIGLSDDFYFDLKAQIDQTIPEQPVETAVQEPPAQPEVTNNGPPSFIRAWNGTLAASSKVQLSKAKIGMSETEVTNLLGSPSSIETFLLGDDVFDVWFYEGNSRPLTFKNSVLVAKSTDYYNEIKSAATPARVDCYDKEAEQMKQEEDEQNFNYW